MNKLKTLLLTLVTLFAFTNVSNAFSLGGTYIEIGSSAVGAAFDGDFTNGADKSTGTLGKTAVTTHYGLGYMTSRDRKLGLDVGYMWHPGEAKLNTTSDNTNTDVTFKIADSTEYYISPMINITEDASLYVKYAWNESDLTVTGDVTKLSSMDGTTTAIGTVMSWGSNLYIRTEAGTIDYDKLQAKGLGTSIATTEIVNADPEVNYGKIAIGYKF